MTGLEHFLGGQYLRIINSEPTKYKKIFLFILGGEVYLYPAEDCYLFTSTLQGVLPGYCRGVRVLWSAIHALLHT
jgi:hypothetical protein